MKSTKEIATSYRLSQWALKLQDRQSSGLSIKSYCEREGIHENVYYYWQRKLRESALELIPLNKEESTSPVPSGWTELTAMAPSKPEKENLSIEIGKSRIIINEDIGSDLLKKVCKVLVELC